MLKILKSTKNHSPSLLGYDSCILYLECGQHFGICLPISSYPKFHDYLIAESEPMGVYAIMAWNN